MIRLFLFNRPFLISWSLWILLNLILCYHHRCVIFSEHASAGKLLCIHWNRTLVAWRFRSFAYELIGSLKLRWVWLAFDVSRVENWKLIVDIWFQVVGDECITVPLVKSIWQYLFGRKRIWHMTPFLACKACITHLLWSGRQRKLIDYRTKGNLIHTIQICKHVKTLSCSLI
jgi:hypothetical protein